MQLPNCPKCKKNQMVPLSDFGVGGHAEGKSPVDVMYKAWVCVDSTCQYHIRIDRGEISYENEVGKHYAQLTEKSGVTRHRTLAK